MTEALMAEALQEINSAQLANDDFVEVVDVSSHTRRRARIDELSSRFTGVALETYNVKDFDAVGDGTTDDTAAITRAIEKANANGGGIVQLPAGTYIAQGLPIYERVYFRGAGPVATTIQLPATPSGDLFVATFTGDFDDGGFADLTLSGGTSTSYDGVSFAGVTGHLNRFWFDNVAFYAFRDGFHGPDAGANNFSSGNIQNEFETHFSNCSWGLLGRSMTFTGATNDTCTSAGHKLRDGAKVRVSNSGGALPTGLAAATDYYVRDAATDTFKLTLIPGGTAVDITGTGSGTHTLKTSSRCGAWTYENPFFNNCRFNGPGDTYAGTAGVGITGRISDAFVVACSMQAMDCAIDGSIEYRVLSSFDATANTFTKSGHGLVDAQQVTIGTNGGTLPTGLAANTLYYVRDVTASTFKLAATSGGSAIDFSGGSGELYIRLGNGIINSQIISCNFYGQTSKSGQHYVAVDQSNSLVGNWFESLAGATSADTGLLIRGNYNTVVGNLFGRASGGGIKGGYSTACIRFSRIAYSDAASTAVGIGNNIAGNVFYLDDGPAIVGDTYQSTSAPEHTGISITGNSFYVNANYSCIKFAAAQNASNFPFCRGNDFSGNTFYLNVTTLTAPPISISYSYYGNKITGNNFRCAGGTTHNTPLISGHLQASLVSGNRVHAFNTGNGSAPIDVSNCGINTSLEATIDDNQVVDGSAVDTNPRIVGGPNRRRLLGRLIGANFNSTSDQAIAINSAKYVVDAIVVQNASTSLTTAAGGIYPAASKSGTALVASSQAYTALTAAAKYANLTLAAGVGTDINTETTLYLSLTTGQGSAATADVFVYGRALQ